MKQVQANRPCRPAQQQRHCRHAASNSLSRTLGLEAEKRLRFMLSHLPRPKSPKGPKCIQIWVFWSIFTTFGCFFYSRAWFFPRRKFFHSIMANKNNISQYRIWPKRDTCLHQSSNHLKTRAARPMSRIDTTLRSPSFTCRTSQKTTHPGRRSLDLNPPASRT